MDNLQALAGRLRTFNEWRRGTYEPMPEPRQIGHDIDAAIVIIEEVAETEYSTPLFERDVRELVSKMIAVGVKGEYFGGFSEMSETGRMIVACAKIIREQLDSHNKSGA